MWVWHMVWVVRVWVAWRRLVRRWEASHMREVGAQTCRHHTFVTVVVVHRLLKAGGDAAASALRLYLLPKIKGASNARFRKTKDCDFARLLAKLRRTQ